MWYSGLPTYKSSDRFGYNLIQTRQIRDEQRKNVNEAWSRAEHKEKGRVQYDVTGTDIEQ